jgi:CrcB protein
VAVVTDVLLVGAGGVAGAVARYLVGSYVEDDHLDTLAVNVLGSFLLGAVVAVPSVGALDPLALAVGVGFCGAFTTFSSFAVETVRLAETGRSRLAVVNAVGTLVAALLAVGLGAGVVAVLS